MDLYKKVLINGEKCLDRFEYKWNDNITTIIDKLFIVRDIPTDNNGNTIMDSNGECILMRSDKSQIIIKIASNNELVQCQCTPYGKGFNRIVIYNNYMEHLEDISDFVLNIKISSYSYELYEILKEYNAIDKYNRTTTTSSGSIGLGYRINFNFIPFTNESYGFMYLSSKFNPTVDEFNTIVSSGYPFGYHLTSNVFICDDPKMFKGKENDIVVKYNPDEHDQYVDLIKKIELFRNSKSYREYVMKVLEFV